MGHRLTPGSWIILSGGAPVPFGFGLGLGRFGVGSRVTLSEQEPGLFGLGAEEHPPQSAQGCVLGFQGAQNPAEGPQERLHQLVSFRRQEPRELDQ